MDEPYSEDYTENIQQPEDESALADTVVIRDLDQTHGRGVIINMKPGAAWMLYLDDGPGGPCGQSMRVTCPHGFLHIWPNEDAMRAALPASGSVGRNKKARVMYGVVDEWTSPGVFQVKIHE